jgi:hypothetical protein
MKKKHEQKKQVWGRGINTLIDRLLIEKGSPSQSHLRLLKGGEESVVGDLSREKN